MQTEEGGMETNIYTLEFGEEILLLQYLSASVAQRCFDV
jgi:hypothetical protein